MAAVFVANGAFKSGSTWIHRLVRDLVNAAPPPDEWLRTDWANPSVSQERLEPFLGWAKQDSRGPYCFKAHYRDAEQAKLLEQAGATVVNIQRDLRDVLVSAFYHHQRLGNDVGTSIVEFYTRVGRRILEGIVSYHLLWSTEQPNVYVFSYERLRRAPRTEIEKVAAWLRVSPDDEEVDSIIEANSFKRLQSQELRRPMNPRFLFHRKGAVGDWQNHLPEHLAEEIERLNAQLPPPSG